MCLTSKYKVCFRPDTACNAVGDRERMDSHHLKLWVSNWQESNSSCFEPALCLQQVLPSLLPLVHLCSATAGSQRQWDPAPAGWPAPSPCPAGPGTVTGSSLRLPAPQMADRMLRGQSTASWLHIYKTEFIPKWLCVYSTWCVHNVGSTHSSIKSSPIKTGLKWYFWSVLAWMLFLMLYNEILPLKMTK